MAGFETAVPYFKEVECVAVMPRGGIALPVDRTADRIHADTVHMKFTDPVVGAGLEKTAHLATGMDKVAAAPFAVVVLFFRVFVQRCTVVVVQRIAVYGEVYRHKVQDYADAAWWQVSMSCISWCAVPYREVGLKIRCSDSPRNSLPDARSAA